MLHVPSLWHPSLSRTQNSFTAFQTQVFAAKSGEYRLETFGCSFYRVYADGTEIGSGPSRYAPSRPEYDIFRVELADGWHLLSIIVHDYGVHTRILMGGLQPFLQCRILDDQGRECRTEWKCKELECWSHLGRRVNQQLGWMEVCDKRLEPDLTVPFAGEGWVEPLRLDPPYPDSEYRPSPLPNLQQLDVEGVELARGTYADRFGYAEDDPPVRFMLRSLDPGRSFPPDGVWFRYDLGHIGLYRPSIELTVPGGTRVEVGYAESLTDGRVMPVIPLSASTSCHVDRWITTEGRQMLQTFVPRGFRYLEVHIAALPEELEVRVHGLQRTMYDQPSGSFICSDPELNRIWSLGVETLRSCSEDALIDSPTRERGQWLGDAALMGMEMTAVAFGELGLIRRCLEQASLRRREDGLAAGLCPGQEAYLSTYALYWIQACLRYAKLTGDTSLLEEHYETADLTLRYFWKWMTSKGTVPEDLWDFLDWGHQVEPGFVNVSLNLLLYRTQQEMAEWDRRQGLAETATEREAQAEQLLSMIELHYRNPDGLFRKSVPISDSPQQDLGEQAETIGYHANVFGLLFDLLSGDQRKLAVSGIRSHMLACFPNAPEAPRLAHPSANHDRLITPSFGHFALQALWLEGEAEFVLEQYKSCWGWMLEQGVTTLLEVFDTRWSHCHAWSGCPTWQLSRYSLGLVPVPQLDDPAERYELRFRPGSLEFAAGILPSVHGRPGMIRIEWRRTSEGGYAYEINTDRPIVIRMSSGAYPVTGIVSDGRIVRAEDTLSIAVTRQLNVRFGY